jgi:hypothetical protein
MKVPIDANRNQVKHNTVIVENLEEDLLQSQHINLVEGVVLSKASEQRH